MIKAIGLALALALALAVGAASPAVATYQIESCMKGAKECKPATVGTTFTVAYKSFVLKDEEEETEECEMTLKAEVTDNRTEKAKDYMSYYFKEVKFNSCTGEPMVAENLPWTWKTDAPELEETGSGHVEDYLMRGWFNCPWKSDPTPPHLVFQTPIIGTTEIWIAGFLLSESVLCIPLNYVDKKVGTVQSVNDPNLAGATGLVIN